MTGSTCWPQILRSTCGSEDAQSRGETYKRHLRATYDWLLRSIRPGGGSSAYYTPFLGWSRPYPETTGYLIPTVLDVAAFLRDPSGPGRGVALGEWLLSIQQRRGFWFGGHHPPRESRPSVFNSAQILKGLVRLYRETGERRWLEAAYRGAIWLADGVDESGFFRDGNYHRGFNPGYYTQVAWPMLEVWSVTDEAVIRDAATRVLDRILGTRNVNGTFSGWGFMPEAPAYTHTIGYVLRGLLESARLLDRWEQYAVPAAATLFALRARSAYAHGRLAGAYDDRWRAQSTYTCLTGNAQIALCFLILCEGEGDPRWREAALALLDRTIRPQLLATPLGGLRGAVAGSDPLWGGYLPLRYPNWAAKYLCDALLRALRVRSRTTPEASARDDRLARDLST
jgi:hypothetical protein